MNSPQDNLQRIEPLDILLEVMRKDVDVIFFSSKNR